MTTTEQSMLTRMIPLSLLKKSPRNVRQVSHTKEHIAALANSLAAHGQIQNLMVETEKGEDGTPTGYFLVNVGEGRRLASLLRVKRKQIKPEEPLRCVVDDAHDPQALSLAENDIRANMHPADQFEAFKRLVDGGISAEDVAAQFGVTPLVVTRRLKLANVAPEFLDLYRKAKLDLEQLMALALTDDHEKQRKVLGGTAGISAHGRRPARGADRERIAGGGSVGEVRGAQTVREGGRCGSARSLLGRERGRIRAGHGTAAQARSAEARKARAKLKAEGWAWVEVMPELDYSALSAFGRVRPIRREATAQESAELERLNRELAEVRARHRGYGGRRRAEAESLQERQDEVGDKIEALEEALLVSDQSRRPSRARSCRSITGELAGRDWSPEARGCSPLPRDGTWQWRCEVLGTAVAFGGIGAATDRAPYTGACRSACTAARRRVACPRAPTGGRDVFWGRLRPPGCGADQSASDRSAGFRR